MLLGSGKRFGRLVLHKEEGERQEATVYMELRSADAAGVSLQVNPHSLRSNCGARDPLQRGGVTLRQLTGSLSLDIWYEEISVVHLNMDDVVLPCTMSSVVCHFTTFSNMISNTWCEALMR